MKHFEFWNQFLVALITTGVIVAVACLTPGSTTASEESNSAKWSSNTTEIAVTTTASDYVRAATTAAPTATAVKITEAEETETTNEVISFTDILTVNTFSMTSSTATTTGFPIIFTATNDETVTSCIGSE